MDMVSGEYFWSLAQMWQEGATVLCTPHHLQAPKWVGDRGVAGQPSNLSSILCGVVPLGSSIFPKLNNLSLTLAGCRHCDL